MSKTPYAQYKPQEFARFLTRVSSERNHSYHCKESTYDTISKILNTDYDEKDADLDYLMDIVNIVLEKKNCQNKKTFPISKYLDWACESELHIHQI